MSSSATSSCRASGGAELVPKLREQRPNVPVLLISGYTFDTRLADELSDEAFLQKPFAPSALLDRVRELLRRRGLRAIRFPGRGG